MLNVYIINDGRRNQGCIQIKFTENVISDSKENLRNKAIEGTSYRPIFLLAEGIQTIVQE